MPTEGKESVIYLVPNGDTSGDENSYYEYLWDKTNSKFELIGSGSYEHLRSEIDKRVVINNPITITEGGNTTSISSDTISTTTLTGTLDAESMKNSLTADAVKAVVPIDWGTWNAVPTATSYLSVALGSEAWAKDYSTALGSNAAATSRSLAVGYKTKAPGRFATAMGNTSEANSSVSITIGSAFEDTSGKFECTTEGSGSITIGAGANTKNPLNPDNKTYYKNSDGEEVESSYSITIGQKAENHSPQNVVIGANAKATNFTQTIDGVEQTVLTSNSVTIGYDANNKGADSVVIGASATSAQDSNVIIGAGSNITSGRNLIAVGKNIKNINKNNCDYSVSVGTNIVPSSFGIGVGHGTTFKKHAVALGYSSQAHAENTIAIGSAATITNTTNADNTVTPSKNTTVIGYGATASAPNAVVLGAGASNSACYAISIGVGSQTPYRQLNNTAGDIAIGNGSYSNGAASVALGSSARAEVHGSISIGTGSCVTQQEGIAIGRNATVSKHWSTAIGYHANVADQGVIVLATRSALGDNKKTQIYIAGAGTDLANEYYNGEAFMGYTVTDTSDNKIIYACGTRRLSEIFTDNTITQPTTLDENGELVTHKIFRPSDVDLPVDEETFEPDNVEINIPTIESPVEEDYKPLPLSPIYPIVEPTIDEIIN